MLKFLVIGDYCKDRFIYGNVNRLSPEAPVPIIEPVDLSENDGMAGNVANNLTNIDKDIIVDFVTSSGECVKTRFVDKRTGYILLRIDEKDKSGEIKIEELSPILAKDYDCVVISDYNKGSLTKEAIQYISENCKLTFLDTKKILGEWAKKISFIKINEKEYNYNLQNGGVLDKTKLIVTLGAGGTFYNEKNYPTKKIEVVNECGCGDTYLAYLAYNYTRTGDIEQSIDVANLFAGRACSQRGVVSSF
jgi:bifunctional ADP-heptose synthase (sugar kinase/adenylyltransferase)